MFNVLAEMLNALLTAVSLIIILVFSSKSSSTQSLNHIKFIVFRFFLIISCVVKYKLLLSTAH